MADQDRLLFPGKRLPRLGETLRLRRNSLVKWRMLDGEWHVHVVNWWHVYADPCLLQIRKQSLADKSETYSLIVSFSLWISFLFILFYLSESKTNWNGSISPRRIGILSVGNRTLKNTAWENEQVLGGGTQLHLGIVGISWRDCSITFRMNQFMSKYLRHVKGNDISVSHFV